MVPHSLVLISGVLTAQAGPQHLTREQFRQAGRSLDSLDSPQVVIVSPSYRQVRRYPVFANEDAELIALMDNEITKEATKEIEEKIRRVNEALDEEIENEETEIIEELFEDETFVDNVLEEIEELETELTEQALEDLDISSVIDMRNVPIEEFILSDSDETTTAQLIF